MTVKSIKDLDYYNTETLISFVTEHLDPINVKIAELREALEAVTTEQKYLKARDVVHRKSKLLYR